jgi:prepilin-type processing-associated H-X9-DG protein
VYCLNNYNQLARAGAMYANDNQQFYPPNPDDGGTDPGYNWCLGDVSGWVPGAVENGPDAGDVGYITNRVYSLLAPYLRNSAVPFKCPADWRVAPTSVPPGQVNPSPGVKIPVVRSVSANQGVGTVDAYYLTSGGMGHSGLPRTPVVGPWLTGNHTEAQSVYATFGSTSAFKNCSPSQIWIYADEDPYSINDASLAVSAGTREIIDYPSTRHGNAACFGFCDGHSEMHKWQSNLFVLNSTPGTRTVPQGPATTDWFWLAWHATRSSATGTVP